MERESKRERELERERDGGSIEYIIVFRANRNIYLIYIIIVNCLVIEFFRFFLKIC